MARYISSLQFCNPSFSGEDNGKAVKLSRRTERRLTEKRKKKPLYV